MRIACSLLLAIGLAFASLPAAAQPPAGTALWGDVPPALRAPGQTAVLENAAGQQVARAPIAADGRFAFSNVASGRYSAVVLGSAGQVVARSLVTQTATGAASYFSFAESAALATAAGGAAGLSTTASIVAGAAAVGLPVTLGVASDSGTSADQMASGSGDDVTNRRWWPWRPRPRPRSFYR